MNRAIAWAAFFGACAASAALPPPGRAEVFLVPNDQYPTIRSAIDGAQSGDTVRITIGSHPEAITLKDGVIVEGERAAGTILRGGVVGVTGGILRKVTIETAGLTATNVSNLTVQNNIFQSIPGTALSVQNPSGSDFSDNTFSENGTAVSITSTSGSGTAGGKLEANIFTGNNVAIAAATGMNSISRNHFFGNGNDDSASAIRGTNASSGDPLFADAAAGDFHLRTDSPCIDADPARTDLDGTPADLGAYGGPGADPVPSTVSGVAAVQTAVNGVRVSWSANLAYDVAGYVISGTSLVDGASLPETNAAADETQVDVAVAPPVVTAPPPPVLTDVSARDGAVLVRWQKATGAVGYELLVGTSPGSYGNPLDVGNVSEFTVGGLENGVRYYIAATSYAEVGYAFTVACTANGVRSDPSASARVVLDRAQSAASNELSGIPETLVGWPELEDNGYGCFIGATSGAEPLGGAIPAAAISLVVGWAFIRRRARVVAVLALLLAVLPHTAGAQEPRLAFGVAGGAVLPQQSGWGDHYEHDARPVGRVWVGFRFARVLEVGLGGGYWQATGRITADGSGAPLAVPADQTLEVVPTQAYLLLNLCLHPDQLVVPYLAGGYSRYFYRREIEDGDTVRGHLSGYHGRAGLKLLLNRVDPGNARRAKNLWGLQRTYWLVEGEYAKVDDFGDASTDLGGWTFLTGVGLEF